MAGGVEEERGLGYEVALCDEDLEHPTPDKYGKGLTTTLARTADENLLHSRHPLYIDCHSGPLNATTDPPRP